MPLARYAADRPGGRHAGEAIARVNQQFAASLEYVRTGQGYWDEVSGEAVLEEYEKLSAAFPPPLRASAYDVLSRWRRHLDRSERTGPRGPIRE